MLTHLPILQVIVPLLAAPLCLMLDGSRFVWAFALLASLLAGVISGLLLWQVETGGTLSYALGGWQAPIGIEYRIDLLSAYLLLIVSAMGTLVLLGAYRSVNKELAAGARTYFYVAYLLCLAGLLGIVAAGDAFNVFVFLEISSLGSYILISLGRDRRALWAAFQYLVVGTIGATFILIGVGFLYAMTGTLNMMDLAQRIPSVSESTTVLVAFTFLVVGVCLKLAMFPLHVWLPNAYAFAPSIATAFLAASATKVAVYLLFRFSFGVFGVALTESILPLQEVFIGLGLAGVFVASLVAISQHNIKRMLAYSSVAQIGYMIIGYGLDSQAGTTAALLHLFNHALMKAALFMALAAVVYHHGSVLLKDLAGLGTTMPWTAAALVGGGLSLIGVPLTVGFISKWYLVQAALEQDLWWLALLIVVGSLLAIVYVWRMIEPMYFAPASSDRPRSVGNTPEAPRSLLLVIWILVAANLYFGIDTRLPVGIAEAAAQQIFGVRF
ncbi:monovalent cation/H+ antiporter subunit D family protein [Pseudomaricurvus alcaniphilus]|uniref:proton-conducting transporter transmembrane domain-containing protein n=1 Tax=Pseudomaricurvus alcaniphilus TaxID=1166482 RepID=UPI00140B9478|nr:monovalent cation/H+ antiporter subunit D family protein [Pseudomaricurvus alcaniphilus]